ARNFTCGNTSTQPVSTSAPPPPRPPGRCTSSSTTAGSWACTTAMADSTVAASPTTSMRPSRSALSPERKIPWSSTTTTRTRFDAVFSVDSVMSFSVFRFQHQMHLGALRVALDAGAPAVAFHAPDDRFAHPVPVRGDRGGVEARSAVAHEHLDLGGGCLHVHRDGAAGVLGRVGHGLAGGLQQGLVPGGSGALPDAHHVD